MFLVDDDNRALRDFLVRHFERLGEIRTQHGKDAIGFYWGNPTGNNHGALMMLGGLGTRPWTWRALITYLLIWGLLIMWVGTNRRRSLPTTQR